MHICTYMHLVCTYMHALTRSHTSLHVSYRALQQWLNGVGKAQKRKGKRLFMPMRIVLTGRMQVMPTKKSEWFGSKRLGVTICSCPCASCWQEHAGNVKGVQSDLDLRSKKIVLWGLPELIVAVCVQLFKQ